MGGRGTLKGCSYSILIKGCLIETDRVFFYLLYLINNLTPFYRNRTLSAFENSYLITVNYEKYRFYM